MGNKCCAPLNKQGKQNKIQNNPHAKDDDQYYL